MQNFINKKAENLKLLKFLKYVKNTKLEVQRSINLFDTNTVYLKNFE